MLNHIFASIFIVDGVRAVGLPADIGHRVVLDAVRHRVVLVYYPGAPRSLHWGLATGRFWRSRGFCSGSVVPLLKRGIPRLAGTFPEKTRGISDPFVSVVATMFGKRTRSRRRRCGQRREAYSLSCRSCIVLVC